MAPGLVPGSVPRTVRPIDGAAALAIDDGNARGRAVLIADLHLGLGATPRVPLGPPAASAPELAEELVGLCRRVRTKHLVVAGDVKHPIVGVPPWLRPVVFDFFATVLDADILPEVVLGNHDVGLVRHLPKEVVVHPADGAVRFGVGAFHGHRWPAPGVLAQRTAVVGHLHPGFRFAPTAENPLGKRRCWVRVQYDRQHRVLGRDRRPTRLRELIVLPAFHPLAGTEALNRDRPERGRSFLFRRFVGAGSARAYLLDGTDVGSLPTPVRHGPAARAG